MPRIFEWLVQLRPTRPRRPGEDAARVPERGRNRPLPQPGWKARRDLRLDPTPRPSAERPGGSTRLGPEQDHRFYRSRDQILASSVSEGRHGTVG